MGFHEISESIEGIKASLGEFKGSLTVSWGYQRRFMGSHSRFRCTQDDSKCVIWLLGDFSWVSNGALPRAC